MERKLKVIIKKEHNGLSIKQFALKSLQFSSRLLISVKQKENGILLNGHPVFVTAVLSEGDTLEFLLEDKLSRSEAILPKAADLNILYEDEDLLVLNKPANMPVHPAKGHAFDTLANVVMAYYAAQNQNCVFRCVNRIDSGTTGVVILAKHAYAQEVLQKQQADGSFTKRYLAIIKGSILPLEGTINAPIGKQAAPTIRREVMPDGQLAVTVYKTIETNGEYSLLSLEPKTGRTHQIRLHMAYTGHPLLGDWLYGEEEKNLITRPALHCCQIRLIHPLTKQKLTFTAPLPTDFKAIFPNIQEL